MRRLILLTSAIHAIFITAILLAPHGYLSPVPEITRPSEPLPPPAPPPPTAFSDPGVFPSNGSLYSSIYSSLPASYSGSFIAAGVGLRFPELPDMGKIDPRQATMRRVWPGQQLEANIVRRVIPGFPEGATAGPPVSVFIEYLIGHDGSVKVLRSLGPAPYVVSARAALARWQYRPVRFQNQIIEVISRVEVRFDSERARRI